MGAVHAPPGQWQRVAAAFVGDTEVRASLPPFRTVGGETAFFRAVVGDQMSQVVAERTFDLARENRATGG